MDAKRVKTSCFGDFVLKYLTAFSGVALTLLLTVVV